MSSSENDRQFREIIRENGLDPKHHNPGFDQPQTPQVDRGHFEVIARNDRPLQEAAEIMNRDAGMEASGIFGQFHHLSGEVRSLKAKIAELTNALAARSDQNDSKRREWLKQHWVFALSCVAAIAIPYTTTVAIVALFWQHVVFQRLGFLIMAFVLTTSITSYVLLRLVRLHHGDMHYDTVRQWDSANARHLDTALHFLQLGSVLLIGVMSLTSLIWLFWNLQALAL